MATDEELACVTAKQRWRVALEDFVASRALASESHEKLKADAASVAQQKQILDEVNVKLTYLNEKIDAHKAKIASSADAAEIARFEAEMAELVYERGRNKASQVDITDEMSAIAGREHDVRRNLENGKEGMAKHYSELEEANGAIQANCHESHTMPDYPRFP